MSFLRNPFKSKQPEAAPSPASRSGEPAKPMPIDIGEIGVLFDIDGLGGGFYRYSAFKVLFKTLDPKRLAGCTLLDGDTSETLAGRARTYCVAFQAVDSAQAGYIREALGDCDEEGLLPTRSRFVEGAVTGRHPLVVAGRVDGEGRLVVREEEGIGQGWVEGTQWTVVNR